MTGSRNLNQLPCEPSRRITAGVRSKTDRNCPGRCSSLFRSRVSLRSELTGDRTKSAAARNAFLHAAVLGNRWRFNCSRNRAKVLASVAQMDAAHLADFYSCHLVTRCLGRDNGGLALASAAVFSRTRSGVTQSDQRSRHSYSIARGTRSFCL